MSFPLPKIVDHSSSYSMSSSDLAGAYIRKGLTSNTTDNFPSVSTMESSFPVLGGGVQWTFTVCNPSEYDLTLQGDENTTFPGTNVVSAGTKRMFFASSASQGATDMTVQSLVSSPCSP